MKNLLYSMTHFPILCFLRNLHLSNWDFDCRLFIHLNSTNSVNMLLKVLQQQPLLLLQLLCIFSCGLCIRPAFENDPELCPFTNRLTINGQPAEMTPKIPGMKYFRRVNESRENVTINKANSLCRLYNLEAAEILDQDDYNEVISIVKETGWTFWINLKGKYNPEYGRYNFEYTLADGYTKIGFHDFGPESYTNHDELVWKCNLFLVKVESIFEGRY